MHYLTRHSSSVALLLITFALLAGSYSSITAQTARVSDEKLAESINEYLEQTYKPNEPGAAIIVIRQGKVILRKGYGKANLELGVPIEPDMVFRTGSVTKQFTAVAILMLVDQGKILLDDEITKFLPDYPTNGHKITVEHLLTHTSGIKSYTSLPEWTPLWRKDMPLTELIALFKDKPMDFAPGERYAYNNSAYVLLGAIIEKTSGQSYQDFIEKNIFAPLGMKHSYYDDTARVIPRRVSGYSKGKEGFINAAYLSMSQPYAAGSLLSSVDDLATWDAALYTGKLVKPELLKRAWTSTKLNNGRETNYGFGWSVGVYEGHSLIEHSGGIPGFASYALRSPEDRVFVAALTNKDFESPGKIVFKIAAMALGKPFVDPPVVTVADAVLDKYVGVYQLSATEEVVVRRDSGKLIVSGAGGGNAEFFPKSETEFFVKDSRPRLRFTKDGSGAVTGLVVTGSAGNERTAARTTKPLPAERQAAAGDSAQYDRLLGAYELAPGFALTISREGAKLMAQGTGQPKFELFQESPTMFFAKEVEVKVEFVIGGDGKATDLFLHQGGRKLPGKKTN